MEVERKRVSEIDRESVRYQEINKRERVRDGDRER